MSHRRDRNRWIALTVLMALTFLSPACSDDTPSVATTTTVAGAGTPEGVTFAIDETDDGARLRIRAGDDIRARLVVGENDDPPWRASISNPGVLTTGDRIRFRPSETGEADPYDEYLFRAVRVGESEITFDHPQGPRTFTVTVVVHSS